MHDSGVWGLQGPKACCATHSSGSITSGSSSTSSSSSSPKRKHDCGRLMVDAGEVGGGSSNVTLQDSLIWSSPVTLHIRTPSSGPAALRGGCRRGNTLAVEAR